MTTAPTADARGTIDELRVLRADLDLSLGRLDVIESGPLRHVLDRLRRLLETFPTTSEHSWRAAVLTNLVGIVARGEADDYADAALLFRTGGRRVAEVQSAFDELIGNSRTGPLVTAAIHRLARREQIRGLLVRAGSTDVEADLIATECGHVAFWLLLEDVDATEPAPLPASSRELRQVVEKRGVGAWRALLATVAANPFGPDATRLAELADGTGLPAPAQAVEACVQVYRKRFEDAERLEVAREIRELVASSGYSQRQFARHIGTSASRLSTYVNGLVTPSATMVVRIRRCAAELAPGA